MLLTKTVLRRKKSAKSVIAAIDVHGAMVVAQLEEKFAPLRQEGQEIPNYSGTLADLKNQLVVTYGRIEVADDVHLKDVADERRLRRGRDAAAQQLQQVLLQLSQTIDSSYGDDAAEQTLGLGTGLRAIPDQIFDLGRRARDTLAQPDFTFSGSSLRGVELIATELRDDVETPLTDLSEALDAVRQAKRQFDETLRLRLDAVTDFDGIFSAVANWLKAMFLAAGETLLAKRIRPTIPQPSKPGEDDKVVEVDDETGEETDVEPDSTDSPDSTGSTGSTSDEGETTESSGE